MTGSMQMAIELRGLTSMIAIMALEESRLTLKG